MKHRPAPLNSGDTIAIVAPAKAIGENLVNAAKMFFEKAGFHVLIGPNTCGRHHYFSGTEAERLHDFQWALDHPEVKAIVCARGGYGCIQLVDRIQWAGQIKTPLWIVGFSDVTVFHQRMQRHGIPSIHGTMPLNFPENSEEALSTLLSAMSGIPYRITGSASKWNIAGTASGKLVGGNLSILYSLLGTDDQIDFSDTILFIEDLSEPIYHIDRIFFAFSKAGILDEIKGLIIGGMTGIKDTGVPFGKTLEEVILSHFEFGRNIPIAFDFPAGHVDDNQALILGSMAEFSVSKIGSTLSFN